MKRSTVYITEEEVEKHLDYREVITDLGKAFTFLREGKATAPPRTRTAGNGNVLSTMPATIDPFRLSGLKYYFASKYGVSFYVALFDTAKDGPSYIIEANRLGQIRTGALSSLGSTLLIDSRKMRLGVIGTGYQAESQVLAHDAVFELEEIRAYSRNGENRDAFRKKMAAHGIDVIIEETVRGVTRNSEVVCTATNSSEPVITREDFGEAFHVNLVGSNMPWRREASPELLMQSEIVVVEHLEQAMVESSEIMEYVRSGGSPIELKDLQNMESRKSRTVFKTMGNGIEDVSAGFTLLTKMGLHT